MTHSFPSRCSSDLLEFHATILSLVRTDGQDTRRALASVQWDMRKYTPMGQVVTLTGFARGDVYQTEQSALTANALYRGEEGWQRSEEHTSELQSLMRISYAVFCLKKKNNTNQ